MTEPKSDTTVDERGSDIPFTFNPTGPAPLNAFAYSTGEVQLVNYLNGLKKDIGLLINFGPSGVQVKRKYSQPCSI
jgi:hypothetical protein